MRLPDSPASGGASAGGSMHWLDHFGLVAVDAEQTARFYGGLLGIEPVERVRWRGDDARYVAQMLGTGPELELDAAFLHLPGTNALMEILQYRNIAVGRVRRGWETVGTTHIAIRVPSRQPGWVTDPNGLDVELLPDGEAARPSIDHIGVVVSDLTRSARFYGDLLQSEPLAREPARAAPAHDARALGRFRIPGSDVALELLPATGDGGHAARPAATTDVGATHIGISVPSVDAELARLAAAPTGAPVTVPYGPYKGGRSAYVRDPDGVHVQLMQLAGRPGRLPVPDAMRA